MKDLQLERRHMLSGGLALGSASLLSAKARGMKRALRNDGFDEAEGRSDVIGDEDAVLGAPEHARFRAVFLAWLDEARGRFRLPVSAQIASPTMTVLHTPSLHPALSIALSGEGVIGAFVTWKDVFWDAVVDLDVWAEPADDGAGWHDERRRPEYRLVYPTRKACWCDVGFEALLNWFNDELVPATHLALIGGEDCYDGTDWTAAFLVRDGAILSSGRPVGSSKSLRELLLLHTTESSWSAAATGRNATSPSHSLVMAV